MIHPNPSVIYCDNCATLALAKLDDAPLCAACLVREVAARDVAGLRDRVEPLTGVPDDLARRRWSRNQARKPTRFPPTEVQLTA